METRIAFEISGEKYQMFIIRKLFYKKVKLLKAESEIFASAVPVVVTTSTHREHFEYWLRKLKRYMRKKRRKKGSNSS